MPSAYPDLSPNDFNRTVGMEGNRFSNASHQQSIQAVPAMRAKDNQIRSPRFCLIKNECPRFAYGCSFAVADVQTHSAERPSGIGNSLFCTCTRILPHLLKKTSGVLCG